MTTMFSSELDEKFYEILDKYKYSGVEPLESWLTEDLVELQEVIRAELLDRDMTAQEDYFHRQEYREDSYGGTDSEDDE